LSFFFKSYLIHNFLVVLYFIQYQFHIHRIQFYVILRCVWDANTRKNFVLAWKMTIQRLTAGISFHLSTPLLVSWSLQSAARMSSSELRDRSFCTHKSWPYIIITRGEEIGEKIAFKDYCLKKKTLPCKFDCFGNSKLYQIYYYATRWTF